MTTYEIDSNNKWFSHHTEGLDDVHTCDEDNK